MRHLHRIARAGSFVFVVALFIAVGAAADFTDPSELTAAIDLDAGDIVDITYTGDNIGASVETASLAGLPTVGSSYLELTRLRGHLYAI